MLEKRKPREPLIVQVPTLLSMLDHQLNPMEEPYKFTAEDVLELAKLRKNRKRVPARAPLIVQVPTLLSMLNLAK